MTGRARIVLFLCVVLVLGIAQASSQLKDAPPEVAASMLLKIASFEKQISNVGEVTIYVWQAPKVAQALRAEIGKAIGGSILKVVESGDEMPANKPHILYIGKMVGNAAALNFTRINKVLSASGYPSLVERGVTVGIGVEDDGQAKLMLNLTSSVEEGRSWNPAIMKVAQTIK